MKLVDLCEFYSERGGGVRSYLTQLGAVGSALGHQVTIVAPGPKDEILELGGAKVVRYWAPPMPYDASYHMPWRLDLMRRILRDEAPDVVQASSPFIPAWIAATSRAKVRSYIYHSDPIGCYIGPLVSRLPSRSLGRALHGAATSWMRRLCNSMDATIVAGPWLSSELGAWGCKRVHVVPFGIRHDDFGPQLRDETLRDKLLGRWAAHPEARVVVIAGRMAYDKQQSRLLEAVRLLSARRPLGLLVIGDGPERQRLERMARRLDTVTFRPFIHDRREYARLLATADVLLHGSVAETYGFVLVEALASGTPIVVPCAGAAAALAPPEASELYPPDAEAPAIAQALERMLDRSGAITSASASAAARRQPHHDDHFRELFALYASLLGRRTKSTIGHVPVLNDVPIASSQSALHDLTRLSPFAHSTS